MLLTVLAAVAAEGQGPSQPLTFDVWTWLFQSINVLVIMLLLYKFLWKPVQGIIHKREEFIETSLNKAAESRAEAERLLAEYQAKMQAAREEAQATIDEAVKKAEEARERILRQAEQEAEESLARARADIARERERAVAAIREEVANLVVLAAGKLIGKTLTPEDHKHLVQQFVDQVAAAGGPGEQSRAGDVQ
ncbi:MAG TPA: F0F1 ATP synthase subunit B [Limnochordales bacterium]|nr:F0F1 ATP synthase subunit B [Limnochordales bacterium]